MFIERNRLVLFVMLAVFMRLAGLSGAAPAESRTKKGEPPRAAKALAVETFLADMTRNVAGERITVEALLPLGVDPHGFEPTPKDVKKVAESDVLIVNGAGLEGFLDKLLREAGGTRKIVEAAAGLRGRVPREGEKPGKSGAHDAENGDGRGTGAGHGEIDPHFWLDPVLAIAYVENIKDGLSAADPAGAAEYSANAGVYVGKLKELDLWIRERVRKVPEEKRVLVTNHESFGYFADRYGFRVIGTVIPSVSTDSTPSAREFAALVETVRRFGAPAIFLETGANPKLADQLAEETRIRVVKGLYTHSITGPEGDAPSYIEMMKYNTTLIVEALK